MRSYLYVPGDNPAKLAKALTTGADALIVDLEDAVPPAGKDAARAGVADFLGARTGIGEPRVWVRVNPGELGQVDAAAVVGPQLAGLCVAKADSVDELTALDRLLTGLEAERGLASGTVRVVPLLESAAAVLAAPAIARAPRVVRLQLGEADLAADLGVTPGPDGCELLWVRSHAVLACAAAGIAAPVAPVSTDFRDLDALRESTLALKRLGFRGRACIHPAQLPVVHEVFTPTEAELAAARDVVTRHDQAMRDGTGVCLDARGRLVDEAVVRSARRLLDPEG
ncbi:HpcH/HpaI aldolase/citrate lyase family protein [Catellatospora tritici]|uniref:HpcH/HpaI aldolase/citrate lyase family protein n=1 Tax=Catellatospora tritici TaxID=2851566 RepID=UPI001C2DB4A7|nr:CoA ester lyase [Catellatospora tritici]MBV1852613.1 CoA ester lyase [Catellatospora tritici]